MFVLFTEVLQGTWKDRDFHKQGSLSLFWITLLTEHVEVIPSEFLALKMCLCWFRAGRFPEGQPYLIFHLWPEGENIGL